MVKKFRYDTYGFEVEIGKFAQQANGAVWFSHGGTKLLSTATSATSKDFPGFFPLTIEYREHYSAAGKIPGGYFKREGKSTDQEVLTGRLIDRALRPLFPENYFDQVQIVTTVYSVDREHRPNIVALIASSLALVISDIPFIEPVGAVEIARVNGEWIMIPTYEQAEASDVRIVIAGTQEGICMVEGSADSMSEQDFIDIMFRGHEEIKKIVAWQQEIARELGKAKAAIADAYQWNSWKDKARSYLSDDRVAGAYIHDKVERSEYLSHLQKAFNEQYQTEITDMAVPMSVIGYIFDAVLKDKLTDMAFKDGVRIDGRKSDQIRAISVEVGLLPFVHGSALFTRGRTQALVSVTLGGGDDAQRVETLMGEQNNTFMLHYNFPPFSVGEVRPMRGPGRREVGHGHLARSAFDYQLPDAESFPYTIRVVSDILESDGSSSMATACGTTMALMQAGVPIKKMVAGIAMGLLKHGTSGDCMVLSDINGVEDAFGLMDFKVVGTTDGITAIQMDIKYKGGLTREIFEKALEQARTGRLHIMGEMQKVMSAPNPTLSDLVPKVFTLKIATDKIGAIIGAGGKTIREITETTGTKIDIEPDGLVKIFGGSEAKTDVALHWVKTLAGQIEKGTVFVGKIRRIVEFGMFVELVPGLDGLVHISNIPKVDQKTFARDYKVDDMIRAQILDYDESNGRISLKLIERVSQAPEA